MVSPDPGPGPGPPRRASWSTKTAIFAQKCGPEAKKKWRATTLGKYRNWCFRKNRWSNSAPGLGTLFGGPKKAAPQRLSETGSPGAKKPVFWPKIGIFGPPEESPPPPDIDSRKNAATIRRSQQAKFLEFGGGWVAKSTFFWSKIGKSGSGRDSRKSAGAFS